MDDQPGEGTPNPFEGTPFEQIFAAFGGPGGGLGTPGSMPDLSRFDMAGLMAQMQSLMQPHEGAVNWTLAKDIARRTVAQEPDRSTSAADQSRVADVVRLADHWLDAATELPSGVSSTAAWSRAEWVEQTIAVWQRLVEPVAEHVVAAMGTALPEQARTMAGPLIGLLGQAGGAMFGTQVGQALGTLAGEVLSASDTGLPVGPPGKAALLPTNVAALAEGLDVPEDDVLLYLALREAAHQRLFAHVPWLAGHLISAVEDYGRGTTIDTARIESAMTSFDPSNPAAMQEALEGGLFDPEPSPAQEAALVRLETALALVEGWVDDVVGQATEGRMPNAGKLQEVIRRRRAAGGPAEQTFAALVGLELRPRRLRDASTLWGSLRSREGAAARDAVWAHPDLLPTATDLDDPLGFGESSAESEAVTNAEFDAALAELLDRDSGDSGDSGEDSGDRPTDPAE